MNIHESHMRWAIALALEGEGETAPNPMVGAIIVKNNKIVGEGYHRRAGTPHAEIHALREAGDKARGADLYVTLEPCAHFGRTPPCVDAIIKAGIKRVFIGTRDPNPLVNGKGIRVLKKSGIKIVEGILENSAREINSSYNKFMSTELPFVTAKVALSLDGKIATANGDSKWITNDECRQYVHKLRSECDAIIVGAGTVKKDDPRLTVRIKNYSGKDPYAVVVDSHLKISKRSNLLKRKGGDCIIATTNDASLSMIRWLEKKGHIVIMCRKTKNGGVNLTQLLRELGKFGIHSVLLEGGGKLYSDFFKNKLIDKFVVCIAPKIVGGSGKDFLPGISIRSMKEVYSLKHVQFKTFGDNIVIEGERS